MRRLPISILTFVALLFCHSGLLTAETTVSQDSVSLNFSWPSDLRGKALLNYKQIKSSSRGTRRQTFSGSYDFRAEPIQEGLLVRYENPEIRIEGGPQADDQRAKLERALLKATSSPPDYIISTNGKFVRLEGMDRFQENLREALGEVISDLPEEAQERVMHILGQMTTEEQLEKKIMDSWDREVGAWIGATLDQGDVYEAQYTTKAPALQNAPIPMKAQFKYIGRTPCNDESEAENCVELEMLTEVNSEILAQALEDFLQKAGISDFHVEEFQLEEKVQLITEPGTLIPHRMHLRRLSSTVISQNGQTSEANEYREIKATYTY